MVLIMSSDEEIEVKVIYVENVERDTVQDVLYHHLEEKFYQRTYRNLCLKYFPELEQPSPLEGDHEGIQLPTHTAISDEFISETELYNDFPQFEDEDTGEIDETAYLEWAEDLEHLCWIIYGEHEITEETEFIDEAEWNDLQMRHKDDGGRVQNLTIIDDVIDGII
jgi:hypothetical protein